MVPIFEAKLVKASKKLTNLKTKAGRKGLSAKENVDLLKLLEKESGGIVTKSVIEQSPLLKFPTGTPFLSSLLSRKPNIADRAIGVSTLLKRTPEGRRTPGRDLIQEMTGIPSAFPRVRPRLAPRPRPTPRRRPPRRPPIIPTILSPPPRRPPRPPTFPPFEPPPRRRGIRRRQRPLDLFRIPKTRLPGLDTFPSFSSIILGDIGGKLPKGRLLSGLERRAIPEKLARQLGLINGEDIFGMKKRRRKTKNVKRKRR